VSAGAEAAPKGRVIVADDEESVRWTLARALEREGYAVEAVADGEAAVAAAATGGADLVLLDIQMPGLDGLGALARLAEQAPGTPVLVMTAYGSLQTAVEAMKGGACDYLTKPFDLEELILTVHRALEARSLASEHSQLKAALADRRDFGGLVGVSQAMQRVFKLVGTVATSDVTVLIQGETGTGKELVARAVHLHSRRLGKPFVPVNCAAVPKDLLESELFGHERGAFTGAVATRRGKFEQAHGGTLFLDEVGEMAPALQTKILRILQERVTERVGGEQTIPVDVRIVAATNQDLAAAVRERRFREDLFYRLNVVTIPLPPLRERMEDVPFLVAHFLRAAAEEGGPEPPGVSPEAMDLLMGYAWPGNVRELENVIARATVFARGAAILPEHLPEALRGGGTEGRVSGQPLEKPLRGLLAALGTARDGSLYEHVLAEVEKPLLEAVLARCGGNQLRAATILGINRNTLRKKLRALGIEGGREARKGRGGDPDASPA
jgi:two-component system nitrogen regulation response regulator GlnG